MRKRSSTDVNEMASLVIDKVIADGEAGSSPKNPAAVALGRLGGMRGGKARAEALSPRKRSQIARKAAKARWSVSRPE
jgi:hypothetical protein